jgi:glycolate oxidase FAD binding subunit
MSESLKPRDGADVEEAVAWALAAGRPLAIEGQGSKRSLGRPVETDVILNLSGLSGVTLYEPEELVLSAKAGTPIADIERLVASRHQELAFEPMEYGPLYGQPAGGGTIGGVLAANLSGPRRIKAGAARDHFLGVTAVSGRGETFKSGGRVVKNVTGYDLCKLFAGSFGTLAVMTEVTIKTLPRAETEESLLLFGLDDAAAMNAMSAAMGSSCDVSGAAHLPAAVARRVDLSGAGQPVTAFRLEGVAPSVVHRRDMLLGLLKAFGGLSLLDEGKSRAFWRDLRDVTPFVPDRAAERALWRISTIPSRAAEVTAALPGGTEFYYDWAGGLIWIATALHEEAGATAVRRAVARAGGHATLVRAPDALRAGVDVFQPQEAALAALTRRVKESFDPKGILNPGRMWAGI